MELYDVMRSTPAVREFTDDPLPDDVLGRILDNARFAPSGGNRQGVRVVVVRAKETRSALADLALPAARRYAAQLANGESPWNPLAPTGVTRPTIEATAPPAPHEAEPTSAWAPDGDTSGDQAGCSHPGDDELTRIAPSTAFDSVPTQDLGQGDRINLGVAAIMAPTMIRLAFMVVFLSVRPPPRAASLRQVHKGQPATDPNKKDPLLRENRKGGQIKPIKHDAYTCF
ncbi:nitroreductase family protein [Mycobacterium sp.]|uniref:nitroreductase family protein n=1 Tax=Mycobacterium sp. TaxID=1785 RepID=UPI003F94836B